MQLTISLQDLGVFVLFVIAIVAGVYLILTLKRLFDILTGVKKILTDNDVLLSRIADNTAVITDELRIVLKDAESTLPSIMKNVQGITTTVHDSARKLDMSVHSIGSGISETVAAVQGSARDINTYIGIASEVASFVSSIMPKNKKRRR